MLVASMQPVLQTLQLAAPAIEVLDLRHFSAALLRPLLHDEARRWQLRLQWDYTQASDLLLDYLDSRILAGYVACDAHTRKVLGYAFYVFEQEKAVIGDIYAFHEAEARVNPICERLLAHVIETLQATPGVDRIESQLLMFPAGALRHEFASTAFRTFPRLFMTCDLSQNVMSEVLDASAPMKPTSWRPSLYEATAALIHRCYLGHMDSQINDQYQTIDGAQRFLHNIIRFPGCGTFDAENSLALRDPRTGRLQAVLLCSRIRPDVAHITQLCVDPDYRGQGLGQLLLHHCMEHIARRGVTTLSLTVTEANTAALRLYERNGFTTQHRFEAMVWNKS